MFEKDWETSEEAQGRGSGPLRAAPTLWLVCEPGNHRAVLTTTGVRGTGRRALVLSFIFLLLHLPRPCWPTELADLSSMRFDLYHPILHSILFRLFGVFLFNISFIIQPALELCWTGSTVQRKWLVWDWFGGISQGACFLPQGHMDLYFSCVSPVQHSTIIFKTCLALWTRRQRVPCKLWSTEFARFQDPTDCRMPHQLNGTFSQVTRALLGQSLRPASSG